jgi:hypothetical protein
MKNLIIIIATFISFVFAFLLTGKYKDKNEDKKDNDSK